MDTPGEYWDEDTGLQYLRSRWYDPGIGRFIQEDAFEGYVNGPSSRNPYVYVTNNPLIYIDPTGHNQKKRSAEGPVSGTGGSWSSNANRGPSTPGPKSSNSSSRSSGSSSWGTSKNSTTNNQSENSGRRLKYDPGAIGPHTTIKRDGTTNEITHYQNWDPAKHPKNPNKFTPGNRYDGKGPSHVNKVTGEDVMVPHVHDKSVRGGIRPARPDELPLTGYARRD